MRLVREKIEYIINCKCGTRIAYSELDTAQTKKIRCTNCNQKHYLDCSHDTYMLERVKIYWGGKVIEHKE